ncbi:phospholipid-transporting ATPase ABCA3-like [Musca autumnalis]|uniref:phospholipid-transporting ATPase ABCA3-like n=1 Tax=Musca autumnalis TaxID=221902 RepID=UPI003CEAEC66
MEDNSSENLDSQRPSSRNSGPANYNSEWDKFTLLYWKNIRLLWTNWHHFVISLISPIIFCTVLVSLRCSLDISKQPIETYPMLDLNKYWRNLLNLIDGRKEYMQQTVEGFQNNPFVPQLIVGFAPKLLGFENIMKRAINKHLRDVELKAFETCHELRSAIINENLLAGVCFRTSQDHEFTRELHEDVSSDGLHKMINGLYPNFLKYNLIFPYACRVYHDTFIGISWHTNSLYHFINRTAQRNIGLVDGGYVGYIREGFAPLQNAISMSYLELIGEVLTPDFNIPSIYMKRYPSKEFLKDDVVESIDFSMSLMLVLGNYYPVLIFVSNIVQEKENKLKTYSRIMGIANYIHFLGWLADAFLRSMISSLVLVTLLKIKWSNGVAILDQSGFFALLTVVSIYNMAGICFVLMVSSFYKKTLSAVAGTAILWFATFVPYILSLNSLRVNVWEMNFFVMVFHNTALGYTLENIIEFELFGHGFDFELLFDTRPLDNTLSTAYYLGIMLMQCCIYACVSLYVEEIMPGNFGLAKRWNFLFTFRKHGSFFLSLRSTRQWRRSGSSGGSGGSVLAHSGSRSTAFVYEIAGARNPTLVDIQSVCKSYGEEEVVLNNINLQLHNNEITILLGHNGSGKSVLLSIISGLVPLTSGSITINGFDVIKDQRYAFASLGLSMGDSVLYSDLTVEDQLRFCSYLKGMESLQVEKEVERYLKATKLKDYRMQVTSTLPQGIRQQLAICCALTGQSRVVLMDSPMAHMDLPSCNMMWKLLDEEKINRSIFIATNNSHFLDNVGDRLVIISNGKLQCDGTPSFIKKMYGQGYRLIILKSPGCKVDKITEHIRRYIPQIIPLSNLGYELIYPLEEKYSDVLEALTNDLEKNMLKLDIETVTLSSIQIEDIFFKLGAATPSHENRQRLMEIMNGESCYPDENKNLLFMENTQRLQGISRFLQQFGALLRQRFLYAYHYGDHYIRRLLYPPICVAVAFFISAFGLNQTEMPAIEITLDQYPSSVTLIDKRPMANDSFVAHIVDRYKELIFWIGIQHQLEETDGELLSDYFIEKDIRTMERMDQDHHVGVTFEEDYVVAWFNNVALHSVPLSLNLVHNAILRSIYGDQCGIEVAMEPLNNMENHLDGLLRVTINTSNVLAVCISVCLCCLWNSIAFVFVRESRSGFANTQMLAGAKIWLYWLVNVCYDSLVIICMTLTITLAIFLCEYNLAISPHIYGWFIFVFLLSGWCIYSLNYMMSLFFDNPVHAYAISLSFEAFGIICFCHVIEAFEKSYVNTTKTPYAGYFLFLPLFVICSGISTVYYNAEFLRVCGDKDIRMTSIYLEKCNAVPNCCREYTMMSWENGILLETIALIVTIIFCWSIIILMEYRYVLTCRKIPKDDFYAQLSDHKRRHDVVEEMQFSETAAFMEQYMVQRLSHKDLQEIPLVCDRVGKTFCYELAVDRLSLILNRYDCFGIVGVSGCGVSTLFNLIAGCEQISYGRIFINGRNNSSMPPNSIGHGRQELIDFAEITVENALEFICALRSYPRQDIENICLNLAKVLGIFPYYHKYLNTLSEGILRRLNCALAIMGNPEIVMLDMSTAGIDSAGRREIWNILKRMQMQKGRAILYATSSILDCEKYCNRLGFMSHGRFCLIGQPWSLDKLYADYYLLKVKFSPNLLQDRDNVSSNYLYAASLNKLTNFIYRKFPNAVLKEQHGNNFLFLIPVYSSTTSNIFTTMMRNVHMLNIEDFELTRCSLSKAFIEFWETECSLKPIDRYALQ